MPELREKPTESATESEGQASDIRALEREIDRLETVNRLYKRKIGDLMKRVAILEFMREKE